jgi:sugar phosphate isomerase/epimerase
MIGAGLCSVTLRSLAVDEVLATAAGARLGAIEWGGDVHVPPGSPAARDVGHRTTDAGLRCASYGSYLFAGRADPDDVARSLDTAVALGAPNVRVWTDWVGPAPHAEARTRVLDDLAEMADAAADRDLTVSLEFHPGTLTETADSTLRLLDDVAAPNLFTYWQPPVGLPVGDLLTSWRAVRHRASHLHVFRWLEAQDRRPLADGADLWPEILADESPTTWGGPRVAFLEFVRGDDPAQVAEDAAVLRAWLDQR